MTTNVLSSTVGYTAAASTRARSAAASTHARSAASAHACSAPASTFARSVAASTFTRSAPASTPAYSPASPATAPAASTHATAACSGAGKADPVYSPLEELVNGWTHAIGAFMGAVALLVLLVAAASDPSPAKIASVLIYGASFIALYSVSSAYHFAKPGKAKRILRTFDHSTIYLLIAGSYTPFCLLVLNDTPMGAIVLTLQWGLAILGIALNLWNMRSPFVKAFSMVSYVVMGWMIIVELPALVANVSLPCMLWLLAGGISYTVGIVFYALGRKQGYMHCIWHVFVLVGSALQLVSISMLL